VFFDDTLVFKQADGTSLENPEFGRWQRQIMDHDFLSIFCRHKLTSTEQNPAADLAACFGVLLSVLMPSSPTSSENSPGSHDRRQAEEILKQSEEQVRFCSLDRERLRRDLKGDCTLPIHLPPMLGYTETGSCSGEHARQIHHSTPDGSPMAMEN